MKRITTVVIILLACLNLSASGLHNDTTKVASAEHAPDSAKIIQIHNDSLKLTSTAFLNNNTMSPVGIRFPQTVSLAALVHHADSLRALDSAALVESINVVKKLKHDDSVKTATYIIHLDSLKLPQYVHIIDSLKQGLKLMSLDSLKRQAKLNKYELLEGPLYTEIASRYMDYDTISNKKLRLNKQTEVLNYTMRALHRYSAYNDTTGMRICFDNLAKVYFAQKKYPQAKWFILQSNTLSRIKKDNVNVIASLITLSAIQSDIKDYVLAMRDLNDAMQISVNNHLPKAQVEVLKNFALLYSRMKNYPKEELILKKRDSLVDSIRKDEDAKLMAKVAARDSSQVKKADSLQSKKKVYTYNIKKPYKGNSPRKIASL